jgi:hypothetical protein
MQGTVFGTIICTTVMDKLAKVFYNEPKLVYQYKNVVKVPVLGMVDDVLSVSECSAKTVIANATINSFMELNKLTLSKTKCSKIHIGKKCNTCPDLKVQEAPMKQSHQEKYLGDVISSDGTLDATIKARKAKAYAYLSEIRALLSDMPFGKRRLQIGLMLRDAMFVNGVLCNSEAWHNLSKKHIKELETVDHAVMRHIVGAQAKVPIEFLYLETGTLQLSKVISMRRIMYLQNILKRPDHELVKRIYEAQKENPVTGDWTEMVKADLAKINEEVNEQLIKAESKNVFKNRIKKHIIKEAFDQLKETQKGHVKVKDICYEKFAMQEYMKTHMLTNQEVSLLFALRSRSVKGIKANMSSAFRNDMSCKLCKRSEDNQEHCLECPEIPSNKEVNVKYDDIFSQDITEQVAATKAFATVLEERTRLLEAAAQPPVDLLDPAPPAGAVDLHLL